MLLCKNQIQQMSMIISSFFVVRYMQVKNSHIILRHLGKPIRRAVTLYERRGDAGKVTDIENKINALG